MQDLERIDLQDGDDRALLEVPQGSLEASSLDTVVDFIEPRPRKIVKGIFDPARRINTLLNSAPYWHSYRVQGSPGSGPEDLGAALGGSGKDLGSSGYTVRGFAWGGNELVSEDFDGFIPCRTTPDNLSSLPLDTVWLQMVDFVVEESRLTLAAYQNSIGPEDVELIQATIDQAVETKSQYVEILPVGRGRLLTLLDILDIEGGSPGSSLYELKRLESFQTLLYGASLRLGINIQYGRAPEINPGLFPRPFEASHDLDELERKLARAYGKDTFEQVREELNVVLEVRKKSREAMEEYVSAGCPLCGQVLQAGIASGVHFCDNLSAHPEPLNERFNREPDRELYRNNTDVRLLNTLRTDTGQALGYAAVCVGGEHRTSGLSLSVYGNDRNVLRPLEDGFVVVAAVGTTDMDRFVPSTHDGRTPFGSVRLDDFGKEVGVAGNRQVLPHSGESSLVSRDLQSENSQSEVFTTTLTGEYSKLSNEELLDRLSRCSNEGERRSLQLAMIATGRWVLISQLMSEGALIDSKFLTSRLGKEIAHANQDGNIEEAANLGRVKEILPHLESLSNANRLILEYGVEPSDCGSILGVLAELLLKNPDVVIEDFVIEQLESMGP